MMPDFEEFTAMDCDYTDTIAGCLCCAMPIVAGRAYCDGCLDDYAFARCLGGEFCIIEGCGHCSVRIARGKSRPYSWEAV